MKEKYLSFDNVTNLENVNLRIKFDCCAFNLILDLLNDYNEFPYLDEEIVQGFFLDRIELLEKHSEELTKIFNSLYDKN